MREERRGSGLTAQTIIIMDQRDDEITAEIERRRERSTFQGLIEQTERERFAVLGRAGLPTAYGIYRRRFDGSWEEGYGSDVLDEDDGWQGISDSLWAIAKLRGYAEDDEIGFATRMLDDVSSIRKARDDGRHDHTALLAWQFGIKFAQQLIKEEHDSEFLDGRSRIEKQREGAASTRIASSEQRVATVAAILDGMKTKNVREACRLAARRNPSIGSASTFKEDWYEAQRKVSKPSP